MIILGEWLVFFPAKDEIDDTHHEQVIYELIELIKAMKKKEYQA